MKKDIIIGLVLLLALTACAQQPDSLTDGNLANTKWSLVSFGKLDAATPVIEGSTITLELDAKGQAGGTGGCNSYGGSYEVKGNMISFGEVMSTLMACVQAGIDKQEQDYFQALATSGKFEVAGDSLTIWYNDGQSVLNWTKSADTQP